MIRIPLTPISESFSCDTTLLEVVDPTTDEERDDFTKNDWDDYVKGRYERTLLPTLGEARYFSERVRRPVIPLGGKRYRLDLVWENWDEPWDASGKSLTLEETEDPETTPDCPPPDRYTRGGYYWQVFGQPTWVQGAWFPAGPDGRPCCHLVTQENGWGDSGNWNILVNLGDDGLPTVAYFEASCC